MITTPTKPPRSPVQERAEQIYRERIRPLLTEADKGKFLTINIENGTYELDADHDAGLFRAFEATGRRSGVLFTMRVGYRAAASFVPAANNELAEW